MIGYELYAVQFIVCFQTAGDPIPLKSLN